jgi:TolB-like protein
LSCCPLTNLSDDREQQYFADEIPEDLTTDLFRLENMFVSARNAAFTYRPMDTKQIGREPGVRYVAERKCQAVGLNPRLIDAASDAHLWTERFNGDTSYLFTL